MSLSLGQEAVRKGITQDSQIINNTSKKSSGVEELQTTAERHERLEKVGDRQSSRRTREPDGAPDRSKDGDEAVKSTTLGTRRGGGWCKHIGRLLALGLPLRFDHRWSTVNL